MHLEILVEEPSAEAALNVLVPRIIGTEPSFRVHPHQGKQHLLSVLEGRLRAYSAWLPGDCRIVVLVDEDRQDCKDIKAYLETAARQVGLTTKSERPQDYRIVNRLCVEELEAWFIGDPDALNAAFPRMRPTFAHRSAYRNPDTISGGTWESLERLLQRAGYYQSGMPKIEVARRVAEHMDPSRNRSKSFRLFRDTLSELSA